MTTKIKDFSDEADHIRAGLSAWIKAQAVQQNNQRWINHCIKNRQKTIPMINESSRLLLLNREWKSGLWSQRCRTALDQGVPVVVLDLPSCSFKEEGDRSET